MKIETPKRLDQVAELKGRSTTMEIANYQIGDRVWKYDIVHRPDAVAAIVETTSGKFIFVKQNRIPIDSVIVEAVAGCIDGDEHPAECIVREIEEETGYKVVPNVIDKPDVYYLGNVKASPGYSDETLYLYYAKVDDKAGEQRPDDDERIEVLQYSFDEFERMMLKGRIKDSKTFIAWKMYLDQIRGKVSKMLKWQQDFVDRVNKMSNKELLDETLDLAPGDDYDGCFTHRGE